MITKTRLEAFSDAVLAIIITIMVLELRVPHDVELADLRPLIPGFLSYALSFIYLGIYWTNHHHMLHEEQPSVTRLFRHKRSDIDVSTHTGGRYPSRPDWSSIASSEHDLPQEGPCCVGCGLLC